MSDILHIHADSRRAADPVFHMTPELCEQALARSGLAGQVRITTGWNLEGSEEALRTADMLVGFRMPYDAVRSAVRLKAIHLIGAGVEHLRPLDWVPQGVTITNNRGIHRQKAAEFILMALLMLNNRMPALVAAQRQRRWTQIFTTQAKGKTVLIVGAGELGSAGGRAAAAQGFRVIGIRRSGQPTEGFAEMHTPAELHALLPRADFVLVTTPSTAETDGLFGAAEYDLMRPGAAFINFGRARVCDYAALAERLRSGHLSGAILDVFDPEPLPADSALWDVPNLIITPHCSSDDAESYIPATLDLVLRNAGAVAARRTPGERSRSDTGVLTVSIGHPGCRRGEGSDDPRQAEQRNRWIARSGRGQFTARHERGDSGFHRQRGLCVIRPMWPCPEVGTRSVADPRHTPCRTWCNMPAKNARHARADPEGGTAWLPAWQFGQRQQFAAPRFPGRGHIGCCRFRPHGPAHANSTRTGSA